jgi:ATP-dependent protease ClpP protease subunit
MPELAIQVGEYIGPGYVDWELLEFIPGFTVDDIKMRIQFAQYDGVQVDSILLQFNICYGGSTRHAMDIYAYLGSLGLPIRAHVMSVTASSGTIVALAADEIEMEHTAQWMVHRPLFSEGSQSQRSEDIRADADRLDREEAVMVDLYVAATGKTEEEVRALIAVDRFRLRHQSKPAQSQSPRCRCRAGPPQNRAPGDSPRR